MPAKVRFPCRPKLAYWQDFRQWQSILPGDVVFETEAIGEKMVTLRGPGFGGLPYGNGAITMNCDDVVIYGEEFFYNDLTRKVAEKTDREFMKGGGNG